MFYVYLICTISKKKKITYVGFTNNIIKRIFLHNSGKGAKFTRGRKWKLIYYEKLPSKKKALMREYEIKKKRKLRNYLKKNIQKRCILPNKAIFFQLIDWEII